MPRAPRKRSRRRLARLLGLSAVWLVAVLLTLSSLVMYFGVSGPNGRVVRVWHGALHIRWNPDHYVPAPVGDWRLEGGRLTAGLGRAVKEAAWMPAGGKIAVVIDRGPGSLASMLRYFEFPGWMLLLPLGIWLFFAWKHERRCRTPGACVECGYQREGIAADAPCPECGARVDG